MFAYKPSGLSRKCLSLDSVALNDQEYTLLMGCLHVVHGRATRSIYLAIYTPGWREVL